MTLTQYIDKQLVIDFILAKASTATYWLSGFTFVAGLTFNQWLAIGGFTLGFLNLLINWRYKHLDHKLKIKQRGADHGHAK